MTLMAPVMAGWLPQRNPNVPAVVNVATPAAASAPVIGFGVSPPDARSGCVVKVPLNVTL